MMQNIVHASWVAGTNPALLTGIEKMAITAV